MMRYHLQELLSKERVSRRSKGQIIQTTEGQKKFHLLTKGFVKRYLISNNGALGVEVIYGPGDVFPLTLLYEAIYDKSISTSPEVYYYEAMCDTEIHSIGIDSLIEHIEKDPLIYKSLFLEAGTRLHSTLQGLENLTLRNSYKRIAHQLLYFSEKFSTQTNVGTKIMVPLTHQDIADVLSVTRETVSVCMMKLSKKGLIKTGRYIVVPDIKKLEEEAYS